MSAAIVGCTKRRRVPRNANLDLTLDATNINGLAVNPLNQTLDSSITMNRSMSTYNTNNRRTRAPISRTNILSGELNPYYFAQSSSDLNQTLPEPLLAKTQFMGK